MRLWRAMAAFGMRVSYPKPSVHLICSPGLYPEVISEIQLFRGGVVDQGIRITAQVNPAFKHDIGPVGDLQSLPDIVIGNQNSDTARPESGNYRFYFIHPHLVDTG